MSLSVLGNFFEDLIEPNHRLPIPLSLYRGRVQHHPGNVIRTRSRIASHGMFSEACCAPGAKLSQRYCRSNTAADVLDALYLSLRRLHLLPDKRRYIPGMQAVAHLMSVPIKPDILKWPPS